MEMEHWHVSQQQALVIYKRVLRLVDKYLARQKQDLLVTDGRGLMTWKEIRSHIQESLKLKIVRGSDG
jgi:hypothetical protein